MRPFHQAEVTVSRGLLASIFLLSFFFGCAPHPAMTPDQMLAQPPVPDVLQVGDVVEVRFLQTPQLNDTQAINSDGTLALQLLGGVKAAGLSRDALRADLMKRYKPLVKEPELTVIARRQVQRRVFVGGEVNKPGAIEMPGQMTTLQAIMEAGGFNMITAGTKYVLVIRQINGQDYGCALDMRDALDGKQNKPFILAPMDIVWVPRSGINKANQWVDQFINKLVPQAGFLGFYPIGPGGLGRIGIDTTGIRTAPR